MSGTTSGTEGWDPARPPEPSPAEVAAKENITLATQTLVESLRDIAALFENPTRDEHDEELVERWDEYMEQCLKLGPTARSVAAAIEELGRPMTPEEVAEIFPQMVKVAKLIEGLADVDPPTREQVIIHRLRRIEAKIDHDTAMTRGKEWIDGWEQYL